ncbi:MAG: hypothetical protein R2729_27970 [Bryobacteraceae bacterium]
MNRSTLILELRDVHGEFIDDSVRVEIRNRVLDSEKMAIDTNTKKKAAPIKNVAAFPQGLAEVTIKPDRYRMTSLFVNVPAGSPLTVPVTLFVNPSKAEPTFPTITKLPDDLRQLLKASKFDAADWNKMDPLDKAGLMNICAKARTIALDGGRTIADAFRKIIQKKPARIHTVVDPDLYVAVQALPQVFDGVNGALHEFPDGWKRLEADSSFKTRDRAGVLQLTFARDTSGEDLWMVDADIDDHSGIEHAFDVVRHHITGTDTNPYDIHQILILFQGLDPGYRLL